MTPTRTKKAVSYHGISLPSPLIEEVKDFIKEKRQYRSVADFTKEALREKMNISNKDFEEDIDKFLDYYNELFNLSTKLEIKNDEFYIITDKLRELLKEIKTIFPGILEFNLTKEESNKIKNLAKKHNKSQNEIIAKIIDLGLSKIENEFHTNYSEIRSMKKKDLMNEIDENLGIIKSKDKKKMSQKDKDWIGEKTEMAYYSPEKKSSKKSK